MFERNSREHRVRLLRLELTDSQESVIACQKSAEGIVDGCRPVRVLRHFKSKDGATAKPNRSPIEGPNGPR